MTPDYTVRIVDEGEDYRVRIDEESPDYRVTEVDSGEDYRVKVVDEGEDFTVAGISVAPGGPQTLSRSVAFGATATVVAVGQKELLRAVAIDGLAELATSGEVEAGGGGAMPVWQSVGTPAESVGSITPALPSGVQANDILLLFVESANEAVSLSDAQGFVEIADSPQGTGTAGGAGATRLAAFWKRATGSDLAPTVADPGDHVYGIIHRISGCTTSGNPWDVTSGGVDATNDTEGSIPGDTTTVENCLIGLAIARNTGAGSGGVTSWVNADLANIIERSNAGTFEGNDGGLALATGEKASAGAYGTTVVTFGANCIKGFMSIALKP